VAQWGTVDLTDIYHQARKDCFEQCPRKIILAQPGESYVLHRLAMHGIAPWGVGAQAPPEGRIVAYFRPQTQGRLDDWLNGDY